MNKNLQIIIFVLLLIPPIIGIAWLIWFSIQTGLWIILLPSAIISGVITYHREKNFN